MGKSLKTYKARNQKTLTESILKTESILQLQNQYSQAKS